MRFWALAFLLCAPVAWSADEPEPSSETPAERVKGHDPLKRLPTPTEAAEKAPPPELPAEVEEAERPQDVPADWEELEVGVDLMPPYEEGGEVDEEVTVWGTAAIRQARDRLILRMIRSGWEPKARREDGTVVFKGPESWMGAAMITPDGLLDFRRNIVSVGRQYDVQLPPGAQSAMQDRAQLSDAGSTRMGGITGPASKRKLAGVRAELQREVEDDLRHMRRVLSETALQEKMAALPDKLDRLWREGLPLRGTELISSPAERRAAVVEYWATRPDSRDGRMAQRVVADWVSQVVQNSAHPFTAEELRQASRRRPESPPLVSD